MPDSEYPATYYVTFDRYFIERSPIIQKDRIGQATNDLEEIRQAWTDTFKSVNPIIWEQLFQMLGATYVLEYSKGTQRLRNGCKAYRKISMSLFGDNIAFFWSEPQKKNTATLKYRGESRNFTWIDFVNRHLALHNQRAALNYHASELCHVVNQWTKYEKVGYLLNGISKGVLEVSKGTTLADQSGLLSNFPSATQYVMDFIERTSAASSESNHTF